jgi:hypothetical protein
MGGVERSYSNLDLVMDTWNLMKLSSLSASSIVNMEEQQTLLSLWLYVLYYQVARCQG